MVPLLIAPRGGELRPGLPAQRTFATARSVEFDAVLVGGAAAPAPDALPSTDAKAGAGDGLAIDPRVRLLLEECFRHAKAIGAWGAGRDVVTASGCIGLGVVTGEDAGQVLAEVQELMAAHRVWERFAPA
jgi:catalase